MARPTLFAAEQVFGEPVPTPERLLRAATDLFATKGLDGVTLQDIAEKAGVTTGAIYGNFGSKERFLLEALAWIADKELSELLHEFRPSDDDDTRMVMQAWADRMVDPERSRHRRLLLEAVIAARRNDEALELVRTETVRGTEKIKRAVAAGQRRGVFAADLDPDATRWFMHAVVVGMAHLDGLGIDLPDHESWAGVLEHVFLGLASDGEGEPARERGDRPRRDRL